MERCIDDELPFEIPESWIWVRLIDICEYIQRGKSPKYSPMKKYPVIAQKCNQWSGFSIEKAQFIEPESIASYGNERFLQDNDLMWNSTGLGTLGRMAVYKSALNPYELAVADSHDTDTRPLKEFISPQYLYYYFSNPTVQSVIEDQADGTTKQKELSATTVKAVVAELRAMKLKEAAKKVEDGIEETLTYCDFPSEHWTRIRTNNVIERLNREIRRRTRVVGTFPDGNSALMLVCARLRYVAGTQWGNKKYMNMKHLEVALDDAFIAG